jgi:hypothetical protein
MSIKLTPFSQLKLYRTAAFDSVKQKKYFRFAFQFGLACRRLIVLGLWYEFDILGLNTFCWQVLPFVRTRKKPVGIFIWRN